MSRKKDKSSTAPHSTKGNKVGKGSRSSGKKSVPQATVKTGGTPTAVSQTVELPVVDGGNDQGYPAYANSNGNGNGNGHTGSVAIGVRPVKVRVGNGYVVARGNGNGHAHHETNGNGKSHVFHNGNGNGYGRTARIGSNTRAVSGPLEGTGRLREADLTSLRLRLKTSEWDAVRVAKRRRSAHKRPLPYFMMRHRSMRSNSRVGHVRSQAAVRKYGSGGAISVVAR